MSARRTKASRRAAFRRHLALPRLQASLRDLHRAADAFFGVVGVPYMAASHPVVMVAGESLDAGQLVTRGADGRVYRAVR